MPKIQTTNQETSRQLPITLQREFAFYPGNSRYDALQYLVEKFNYTLDIRKLKHGLFS